MKKRFCKLLPNLSMRRRLAPGPLALPKEETADALPEEELADEKADTTWEERFQQLNRTGEVEVGGTTLVVTSIQDRYQESLKKETKAPTMVKSQEQESEMSIETQKMTTRQKIKTLKTEINALDPGTPEYNLAKNKLGTEEVRLCQLVGQCDKCDGCKRDDHKTRGVDFWIFSTPEVGLKGPYTWSDYDRMHCPYRSVGLCRCITTYCLTGISGMLLTGLGIAMLGDCIGNFTLGEDIYCLLALSCIVLTFLLCGSVCTSQTCLMSWQNHHLYRMSLTSTFAAISGTTIVLIPLFTTGTVTAAPELDYGWNGGLIAGFTCAIFFFIVFALCTLSYCRTKKACHWKKAMSCQI